METLFTRLHSSETRSAVIDAVLALFTRWRLHDINQAQLLGVGDIGNFKYPNLLNPEPVVLARAGDLLAIDRALNRYYAYQPRVCDRWVSTPQKQLNGATPLAIMLTEGYRGIGKIRELVESQLRNLGSKRQTG